MKRFIYAFSMVVCVVLLVNGCSSAPKVTRKPTDEMIDLSGHWNDTDSQMVANTMVEQCLNGPWLSEFNKNKGSDPIVIVGTIINRSHEHINVETFVKDLEMSLLNSGKVSFVADKQDRLGVREEREDMMKGGFTNPDTIKAHGSESGADFMLMGVVTSLKDEIDGKYVNYFQVNLELVDMSTNQKRWMGQHKIKKLVEQRKFKW